MSEEPDRDTPEVESIVTFSTFHIAKHDDVLLTRRANVLDERVKDAPFVEGPIVFMYDSGFFVRLSDETFSPDADQTVDWLRAGYTASLVHLLQQAWKWGHRWVRLDAGGPVVEGLPTFKW